MSLEDLSGYASDQEERINAIPPTALGPASSFWNDFRTNYWGKPLTSLEKEELVEDDLDPAPSPTPPTTRSVLTITEKRLDWDLAIPDGKILLRSEYYETEQAALSASACATTEVFVVTGHPGIVRENQAILFHEKGASELTQLKARGSYFCLESTLFGPLGRIWALVDTNKELSGLAPIFAGNSEFYVVNAVSVGSEHPERSRKIGREWFYQKPWSASEILQARSFFGASGRQLMHLYNEFGASPRELRLHADKPSGYQARLIAEIKKTPYGQLPAMLEDPSGHKASPLFVVTEPSPDRRDIFTKRIASKHVFDLLWEVRVKDRINEMAIIYEVFSGPPFTTAAELVFEYRMHEVFASGRDLQLFPVLGELARESLIYEDYNATRFKVDWEAFRLAPSEEHEFDVEMMKETVLEENRYYRPKTETLPGIDSFFLYHPPKPILFMFQMIQAREEHDVNPDGLTLMGSLKFPRGLANVRKIYIVVTPEGIHPKITVPKKCLEFEVFHHPVVTGKIFS